jgi:hypothetical protein
MTNRLSARNSFGSSIVRLYRGLRRWDYVLRIEASQYAAKAFLLFTVVFVRADLYELDRWSWSLPWSPG